MIITRILMGDLIFSASGLASALLAVALSTLAPWPRRWRIAYAVVLAVGLTILAHWAIEAAAVWWDTPLAPHMELDFG